MEIYILDVPLIYLDINDELHQSQVKQDGLDGLSVFTPGENGVSVLGVLQRNHWSYLARLEY